MTTKKCLYCGEELYSNSKDPKRQKYCSKLLTGKDCSRKHWRETHPEEYKAEVKAYGLVRKNDPILYAKDKEKANIFSRSKKGRFNSYKSASGHSGREFSLTKDQFNSFWNQKCTYCGEQINGVGIDRIDNSKGYVIENCTPCCITCNNMKKTLTKEFFIEKCKKIVLNTDQ